MHSYFSFPFSVRSAQTISSAGLLCLLLLKTCRLPADLCSIVIEVLIPDSSTVQTLLPYRLFRKRMTCTPMVCLVDFRPTLSVWNKSTLLISLNSANSVSSCSGRWQPQGFCHNRRRSAFYDWFWWRMPAFPPSPLFRFHK